MLFPIQMGGKTTKPLAKPALRSHSLMSINITVVVGCSHDYEDEEGKRRLCHLVAILRHVQLAEEQQPQRTETADHDPTEEESQVLLQDGLRRRRRRIADNMLRFACTLRQTLCGTPLATEKRLF